MVTSKLIYLSPSEHTKHDARIAVDPSLIACIVETNE